MWKRCCLDEIKKEYKGEAKITTYNWCLTDDSVAMTIEANPNSQMYKAGHLYIQFYPSSKNQFFGAGHYPYKGENETPEFLLQQNIIIQMMEAATRQKMFDEEVATESLNRSGYRIALETEGNDDRDYGARREDRVSWDLLLTLAERMKESPIGGPQTSNKPYFVHPTRIVNRFTQEIVFTYARLFQEILGFAKRGYLPPEQIKLGYAIVKLLKISWGTANLEREPSIWQKEYRVGRKNDGPLVLGIVPYKHF